MHSRAGRYTSWLWLACLVLLAWGALQPLWAGQVAQVAAPAPDPPPAADDFWYRLLFGAGWLGFTDMMLLALASVSVVAIAIECFWTIRKSALMPQDLAEQAHRSLREGDLHKAEQLCEARPSFLSAVLLAGIREVRHGFEATIKAMEDAAQAQHAKLQRKVDYLNLLGCLGPLIGLMGTVWGMIVAFTKVAETHGRADPSQLAGGIAHGLYATVIGLAIAVVGLTCYGILRNWVDGIAADCSALAERTIAPLRHARFSRRSEAKSAAEA